MIINVTLALNNNYLYAGHTFINRIAAGDILRSSFVMAVCNKIVLISSKNKIVSILC